MKEVDLYIDPEVEKLKQEIINLENEIGLLATEKGEIERRIHQYQIRYNRELGEIIQKIFEKRRDKLKTEAENDPKKESKYEEAEKDYQDFKGEYERASQTPPPAVISEEEQSELKEKYRKACKQCHPDKVAEHLKEKAEQIFVELQSAYENNNLQKVTELLAKIESGIFDEQADKADTKELLLKTFESLTISLQNLQNEVAQMKEFEVYKTLLTVTNITEHFEKLKSQLLNELEQL
jgi:hypothetical protein